MFKYLFPRSCSLCKISIKANELICHHCFDEIPKLQEMTFRKKNLVCHAGFCYSKHVKTLIKELKFNHKLCHTKLLAQLTLNCMCQHYDTFPPLIIPIPLHKKRLQERGFNQALEIAKIIAKKQRINTDTHTIIRKKPTKPQAQLSASARKRNIKNAFALKRQIYHEHVILFDDVITTGGTVCECYRLLKNSGVQKIDIWSVSIAQF